MGNSYSSYILRKKNNINVHVWVDETRPRNQGASLTSYELNNEGVENTIISDNTAGLLMQRGKIDLCIVGADRVTSNGHVANKIGTFLKAVMAREFNIPFYVAIPTSTIDWKMISEKMRKPAWVFDSRSILVKEKIREIGLNFWRIGDGENNSI